jgi:Protein of unknown function (DUF2947)
MPPSETYRNLDPEGDWAFFDSGFHLSPKVQAATRALAPDSAEAFWRKHFSASSVERHPMLLPADHWLNPTVAGPDWVVEFNGASKDLSPGSGAVASFLRDQFDLAEQELVYFVTMREHSYCAPWWVALVSWPCFLAIEDEGATFFHPESGKFAHFGPNGSVGFGVKAPPSPDAA